MKSTSFYTKLDLFCFLGAKDNTSAHKLIELYLNVYVFGKDESRKKRRMVKNYADASAKDSIPRKHQQTAVHKCVLNYPTT